MSSRRRRSQRRALTEFAERSWIHAGAAWLFRNALLLAFLVVAYLIVMNVLVPNMIDGLVEQFENRGQ